jgi:hypothetical protein
VRAAGCLLCTLLQFAKGGNGTQYLVEGWSEQEPWGVWSTETMLHLQFR